MVPHVIEPAEERVTKILRSFKEPIVSDVFARVVPDAFGRIQFRPVGREREHFHISAVRSEPVRDFRLGVIRGIVLNQVDAVTAAIEGGHHHLLHESQIGLPLKVIFLMEVDEIGVVQTDRSKDLLGMALPQRGNLRLAATLGPGGMQGGRSEEHTSELQSPDHLVCRLLLEKKKINKKIKKQIIINSKNELLDME